MATKKEISTLNTGLEGASRAGETALDNMTGATRRELLRLYKTSLGNIQKAIATLFQRMGDNPSIAEASKFNRLNNLEFSIRKEIATLTGKSINITSGSIKASFAESFNVSKYAIESTLLVKGGFGTLNANTIKASVLNPLDLITWPERMRDNQAKFIKDIKESIGLGLNEGKGFGSIARDVKSKADIGASKLIRIVNTETHRAESEGALVGYERFNDDQVGVDTKKKWLATLDVDTRDTHQSLDQDLAVTRDGQQVFISPSGAQGPGPGLLGRASEDINCRCTTTLNIEGVEEGKFRRARENGKGVLVPNMDYEEWATSRDIKTNLGNFN